MSFRVRCPKCGEWVETSKEFIGRVINCPRCGQKLRPNKPAAPVVGETTFRLHADSTLPEPSMWRNPAVWIALAGVAALVLVFLAMLSRQTERYAPPAPISTGSAEKPGRKQRTLVEFPKDTQSQSAHQQSGDIGPNTEPTGGPEGGLVTGRDQGSPLPEQVPDLRPKTLSAEAIFVQVSPAVVRVVVRDKDLKETGLGSGFFVSPDGLLVTNYHVVKGANFATVVLATGATFFVDSLMAWEEEWDLAVLKVNGTVLPYLNMLPEGVTPATGSRVYAIGNPQGLTNTMSEGIVSAVRSEGTRTIAIQTTAAISPGSSGGPLLDDEGRVVGVTTAYLPGGQNLNFAVACDAVRAVLQKASSAKGVPLASAAGKPMDREVADEAVQALVAIALEQWSDAVQILKRLQKTQPENPVVWRLLGMLHLQLGNNDLAAEAYNTAIRLDPAFLHTYLDLCVAYIRMQRWTEALDVCNKAIVIHPDSAIANLKLGHVYWGMKRYPEAIQAFNKCMNLEPGLSDSYVGAGWCYLGMGRPDRAVESFKMAIRLQPDDSAAYLGLGYAYVKLGDGKQALGVYNTLIRLDPSKAKDLLMAISGM